jgi:hypothetical protein
VSESLNPLAGFSEVRREDILRHVFGDVGELIDDFSCAVESTVLLHGRIYVTTRFVCFYSNLFGLEKKIRIPYTHVTAVSKENTALVIPNAIAITTIRKEYVFRSFWDREACFHSLNKHIKGMSERTGGIHDRQTGVHGYSVKNDTTSPGGSSLFRGGVSPEGAGGGGTRGHRNKRGSRTTSAENDNFKPSVAASANSGGEDTPTAPSSASSSSSGENIMQEPDSSDDEYTEHLLTDDTGEEEEGAGGRGRGRQGRRGRGMRRRDEDEDDDGDDHEDEDDDIVEETEWTERGKETAPKVTSQEDGLGHYTPDLVKEQIASATLKHAVIKETLPVSVQEFAKLFVEDHAEHSWKKYHGKVGDSQLNVTTWSHMHAGAEHEGLGSGREIKFFKPVNLPGLKETRGVKLQKYQRYGIHGLIVSSSTRLEDVPAADTFTVEDVVTVRRPEPGEIQGAVERHVIVEISFEVCFIKSTFLKYMIEASTNTEMTKWLQQFYSHLRVVVLDRVDRTEEKLDNIKKVLEGVSDTPENKGGDVTKASIAQARRISAKAGQALGVSKHFEEAFESWQKVEGRRFFVLCFALLLYLSFTLYWQMKQMHLSIMHLHEEVQELKELLVAVQKGKR